MSDNQTLPTLPALRCLHRLAEVRPTIIIDTREQTPLVFTRLASRTETLSTGDYSFAGGEELFAVERKSINDLVSCCTGDNRDRFFRELHRLRGYCWKRLLIVGTRSEIEAGTYRSRTAPAAILSTLRAIEARFDVPVVFALDATAAAKEVEAWTYWFARELVESANTLARGNGLTRRQTPCVNAS
jgi:DNA excision repair protein ERCC-4